MNWQEWIALSIVGLVASRVVYRFFKVNLSLPLANLLLRKGKVKWAMRLRNLNGRISGTLR